MLIVKLSPHGFFWKSQFHVFYSIFWVQLTRNMFVYSGEGWEQLFTEKQCTTVPGDVFPLGASLSASHSTPARTTGELLLLNNAEGYWVKRTTVQHLTNTHRVVSTRSQTYSLDAYPCLLSHFPMLPVNTLAFLHSEGFTTKHRNLANKNYAMGNDGWNYSCKTAERQPCCQYLQCEYAAQWNLKFQFCFPSGFVSHQRT